MSYFAFGVIEIARSPGRQSTNADMDVCWGSELQQSPVREMLALEELPGAGETPFSLTARGDDTADGLISPYQVAREEIARRVCAMIAWVEQERGPGQAELWLTEGYDDNFAVARGTVAVLEETALSLIASTTELPSLRLVFAEES